MKLQITAILLLFIGEALSVYSEMVAARAHSEAIEGFGFIFSKASLVIALAGACLIAGYMIGYKGFKSIWVVSALSITSILLVEPIVAYMLFKSLPGRGALIGMMLGALGFIATFVL